VLGCYEFIAGSVLPHSSASPTACGITGLLLLAALRAVGRESGSLRQFFLSDFAMRMRPNQ
jgi:hypothetical protein